MEVIIVKGFLKRLALVALDTVMVILMVIGIHAYGYVCRYGIEYRTAIGVAVSDLCRPIDWIIKRR